MTSWANEISPNFYVEPPRFGPGYQTIYDEHKDHISVQNMQEHFTSMENMEVYFT